MGFDLPDVSKSITDPQVKEFLENFYEASNDGEAHDHYTDFFTADADYAMNDEDEIRALRKAIWFHIPGRDHRPLKIYTHGNDQYDLMVHGDVTYDHHYGHQTGSDWTAMYRLVKEGEELKMSFCQILVDSAAHV